VPSRGYFQERWSIEKNEPLCFRKSFGADWKITWLRLKNRLAQIDFSFGADFFALAIGAD